MMIFLFALLFQVIGSGAISTDSSDCSVVSSCVSVELNPTSKTMLIQLTGDFVADIWFEASIDGKNWMPLSAVKLGNSTALSLKSVTGAAVAGAFTAQVAGFSHARVRCSKFIRGLSAGVHLRTFEQGD